MKKSLAVAITITFGLTGIAGCAAPSPEVAAAETKSTSEFSQKLHDLLPEKIKTSGTVSVVGEVNGPWRVVEANDSVTGLQTEILKEFSEILGVEFKTEMAGGLPAVKLGVQSGRNDVGFGPLLSNEKSQKDLLFIDYAYGRTALLYSADKPDLGSLLDLCGSTLAVIEGSAAFDPFIESMGKRCSEAGKPAVNILKQADTNATLVAIKSGRADYAGTAGHRASYFKTQSPGTFKTYITTDEEAKPDHLGMALDPANTQLAEAIFGAWEEVFENGTYDRLMKQYDVTESAMDAPILHAASSAK